MPTLPENEVAVLGLGIIGSRIARNLSRLGLKVWVWNRTPKVVPQFVGTARAAAERARVLYFFLKNGPALLETLEDVRESLTPRHFVISHVTCLPSESLAAARLVEGAGANFLEAPFTGSRDAAEQGKLVYYVGGEERVIEQGRPYLQPTAECILHIGKTGSASLLKIATNLISASVVSAGAEALALILAGGISGEKFLEALEHNVNFSPLLKIKLQAMLRSDFEARFSLANMEKDIGLADQLFNFYSIPGRQAKAFLDLAAEASKRGLQKMDFSVIFELLRTVPPDSSV
ncbi:MAG: NAD(P)-dependent oxidoreductase [Chthoniobacterales bacterium]|nr:NAD(P)-dependent oxidoreductase [Chthoniobacterales bacterium]MCX7712273.1 NAD(P)-dependent oxidoreductase [Chthoniobacterales bacterium]